MSVFVSNDHSNLAVWEAAVEERVPQDDPPTRPEPDGVGIYCVDLVAHRFEPDRHVSHALFARNLLSPRRELWVSERLQVAEIRQDEEEERGHPHECGSPEHPPTFSKGSCEPHHDGKREREEKERAREQQPVRENELEDVSADDVVSPVPPELRDIEGELDEPDDREPEHPEEHSGSDSTGCRLAREAFAPDCVVEECPDQRYLGQHEVPAREALEVAYAVEHARREVPPCLELRQIEVPRNLAAVPQEVGSGGPDPRQRG